MRAATRESTRGKNDQYHGQDNHFGSFDDKDQ
jgi:hypothetical protein